MASPNLNEQGTAQIQAFSERSRRALNAFFAVGSGMFLVFFGLLARCQRLATDDFCALAEAQKWGFWGAQAMWWNNWTGRWGAQALVSFWTLRVATTAIIFPYVIVLAALLIASLGFCVRRFLRAVWGVSLSPFWTLCSAVWIFALWFFACTDRVSLFFWLAGSAVHTAPVILGLGLFGFLLAPRPSRLDKVGAMVCAALLCCWSEVAVALAALGLLVWLIYDSSDVIAPRRLRFWALGALLLAFAVSLSAPGNWQRFGTQGGGHLSVEHFARIFGYFYKIHAQKCAVWLTLSFGFGATVSQLFVSSDDSKPVFFFATPLRGLLLLVLPGLSLFPAALAFGGRVPMRVWAAPTLSLVLFLFAAGFEIARLCSSRETRHWIPRIAVVLTVASGGLFGVCLLRLTQQEIPKAQRIATQFDHQYAFLRTQGSACSTAITLAKLPSSPWVSAGEAMPTSQHWISRCYARAVGLSCPLRRDKMKE